MIDDGTSPVANGRWEPSRNDLVEEEWIKTALCTQRRICSGTVIGGTSGVRSLLVGQQGFGRMNSYVGKMGN
ncbi:hypothetical protein TNCV_465371 [Trichonephila clavipes]|nr:hypothetical protein TNCV_465371 [Trichonephila clavipes]